MIEWFWLADAKLKQLEAEQEAIKAASDPNYVPASVWEGLRAEFRAMKNG